MAVQAPDVARSAAVAFVFASSLAQGQIIDYTDAVVVTGQPIRIVTPSACLPAAGANLTSALSALSRFSQRQHVLLSVGNGPASGFDIQYLVSSAVAADPAFVNGLETAAQLWESVINDPIVVVMAVDFTSGRPYLAAASTTLVGSTYETLRGAMVSKASPAERQYMSRIPVIMQARTDAGWVNTNGMSFFPPSALRRALYIENWTPTLDAQIVFNTDFTFDPDPSNGIAPGQIDLVTVMCHELGHALGFTSSVDANPLLRQPLDMFRYTTWGGPSDPSTLDDITTVLREWRAIDSTLDTVNAILGVPQEIWFSTGAFNGDGRQASHWKDDSLLGLPQAIGVMDPTYQASQLPPEIITDADLLALSLIGWNIDIGTPPCVGDTNGDGAINLDDLQMLLFQFGTPEIEADVNFDGAVNLDDLQLILFSFGQPC